MQCFVLVSNVNGELPENVIRVNSSITPVWLMGSYNGPIICFGVLGTFPPLKT
mgnify:CR=1 FL=1